MTDQINDLVLQGPTPARSFLAANVQFACIGARKIIPADGGVAAATVSATKQTGEEMLVAALFPKLRGFQRDDFRQVVDFSLAIDFSLAMFNGLTRSQRDCSTIRNSGTSAMIQSSE